MVVRFEFSGKVRTPQDLGHIRVSPEEAIRLVCSLQRFGFWRTELDTGHVFWSRDIFEIYGMDFTAGPINLSAANASVHPDDLPYMLELFERAAREKSGFHYILRLKDGGDRYKYVRAVGHFRITPDGREELHGVFEQFHDQVPTIGMVDRSEHTAGVATRVAAARPPEPA